MRRTRLLRWLCLAALIVAALTPQTAFGDAPMQTLVPPDGPQAIANPVPHVGDQKLLVILADFSDRSGAFTGQAWQNLFFGADGFADYYREVSYGLLNYTGDVVGLAAGSPVVNANAVAYVRVPQPITYYTDGQYGFKNGAGQFPRNSGGVVLHAVQALEAAGFDFGPYADAVTKSVDNVIVIFAGSSYAETGDPNHSLEATAFTLTWAGNGSGAYTTAAGYQFNNYTVCPDQRGNLSGQLGYIGICAHEQGHALGMPDLYDYSYTTSGVGNFDIMAYGDVYSDSPFHFSAFAKQMYGWATPAVMPGGTYTVTLTPAETTASYLRLYPNGNAASREYFLLENRQPLGSDSGWLSAGLCAGLVIWHIDEDIVDGYFGVNSQPPYAGAPPHPGVIVVEADGAFDLIASPPTYGECDDTWAVGRTWDASSTPGNALWDGSPSGLSVTVVSAEAGNVTVAVTSPGGPTGAERLYLTALSR